MTTYQGWLFEQQNNDDRPDVWHGNTSKDDVLNKYLEMTASSCAIINNIKYSASSIGEISNHEYYCCDFCGTYNWYDVVKYDMKCKNCGANLVK